MQKTKLAALTVIPLAAMMTVAACNKKDSPTKAIPEDDGKGGAGAAAGAGGAGTGASSAGGSGGSGGSLGPTIMLGLFDSADAPEGLVNLHAYQARVAREIFGYGADSYLIAAAGLDGVYIHDLTTGTRSDNIFPDFDVCDGTSTPFTKYGAIAFTQGPFETGGPLFDSLLIYGACGYVSRSYVPDQGAFSDFFNIGGTITPYNHTFAHTIPNDTAADSYVLVNQSLGSVQRQDYNETLFSHETTASIDQTWQPDNELDPVSARIRDDYALVAGVAPGNTGAAGRLTWGPVTVADGGVDLGDIGIEPRRTGWSPSLQYTYVSHWGAPITQVYWADAATTPVVEGTIGDTGHVVGIDVAQDEVLTDFHWVLTVDFQGDTWTVYGIDNDSGEVQFMDAQDLPQGVSGGSDIVYIGAVETSDGPREENERVVAISGNDTDNILVTSFQYDF